MTKRNLSQEEITDILSFFEKDLSNKSFDINTNTFYKRLYNSLEKIQIYENKIPKLKEILERKYYMAKIAPDENVGVDAALSASQPVTQLVLQTFHLSGVFNKLTSSGVKRIEELMALSRNQSSTVSTIRFNISHSYDNLENIFKYTKYIESTNFEKYVIDNKIIDKKEYKEEWWNAENYNKEYTNVLRLEINMDKCYEYGINTYDLVQICKKMKNFMISYNENTIDIFLNLQRKIENTEESKENINEESNEEVIEESKESNKEFIEESKEENKTIEDQYLNISVQYRYIRILLRKILDTYVTGISGIHDIYFDFMGDKKEWLVTTNGSNFQELISHPYVDGYNTLTNSVWEIYETLGIEATRTFLINELKETLSGSAYVDQRHLMLLVDNICFSGRPASVNRFGITGGPWAKISFEESIKNALASSIKEESDNMKGVAANITLGKKLHSNFELILDNKTYNENENGKLDNKYSKLEDLSTILGINNNNVNNKNIIHKFEYKSPKHHSITNEYNVQTEDEVIFDKLDENENEDTVNEDFDDVYEF